ncbi:centromere protein U isoform X2 [Stegostoma tigrinum]|uniref:centromere protein U isoform X2 n=1 Tax=Stegostoma tigrinum TaxID=3053191 RepID=UPI00286FDBA0|nr:centromere protein U isoform X2 [Stegostoma tigrinum]
MRKSKSASTLKGSNLLVHQNTRLKASKSVRTRRDGRSQTNKRHTPAQNNRAKLPSQKHPEPSPNLSCIFKNPDSQDDDEYYDSPLHSTAVFDGESELNNERGDKEAEGPMQSNQGKRVQQSVPQVKKNGRVKRSALTRISEGVEAEESEMNTGSVNNEASNENTTESDEKKRQKGKRANASTVHSRNSALHAGPSKETSLQDNVKTYGRKRKQTLVMTTAESDASSNSPASRPLTPEAGPLSAKISCPEGMKRLTKNITDLDVVLDNFEEIVTEYKQSMESTVCTKVIDRFFTALKEQITETISQVKDLKNVERANAKVMTTFKRTRQHFLVAQKELNEQEVQLKYLRKEYSELSQKKSDLLLATQFLSGFKQLQTEYIERRSKNPGEKQMYTTSSFPALLLEARGILRAEKQLQIINAKLQQSLEKKQNNSKRMQPGGPVSCSSSIKQC